MKEFIYPEMMVHTGLCTSKLAQDLLIVSDDADSLKTEADKHTETNTTVVKASLNELSSLADSSYDVVVCELDIDGAVASQINRILKDDGQLVTTHPALDEVEKIAEEMLGMRLVTHQTGPEGKIVKKWRNVRAKGHVQKVVEELEKLNR